MPVKLKLALSWLILAMLAGCAGSGTHDGGEEAGPDGFRYGPGATGGMELTVQVANEDGPASSFHVQLRTPSGTVIWEADGTVPVRQPGTLAGVTEYVVERHPDAEAYDYEVTFEARGESITEVYGVSQFHDDAIQLYLDGDKLYMTQAYY